MPGIRISHPKHRNALAVIEDPGRPYVLPFDCPPRDRGGCGKTHLRKTYHFVLDEVGTAIVSTTIWDRIQRIPDQPFSLVNVVEEPPAQRIGIGPTSPRVAIRPIEVT